MLVVPTSEEIVGRDVDSAALSEEQLSWYKDFRNRLHSDGTKYSGKKGFTPILCGVFEETTTYLPVTDGTYPTHTRSKTRVLCGWPACLGYATYWTTRSVEQEDGTIKWTKVHDDCCTKLVTGDIEHHGRIHSVDIAQRKVVYKWSGNRAFGQQDPKWWWTLTNDGTKGTLTYHQNGPGMDGLADGPWKTYVLFKGSSLSS